MNPSPNRRSRWWLFVGVSGFLMLNAACSSSAVMTETPRNSATPEVRIITATPLPPTPTENPLLPPDPAVLFNPHSRLPIIDRDIQYVDPGAVIVRDGVFHMFANVFSGWPARVDIYHYISMDGITWELENPNPVFNEMDVAYAGLAVLAHAVQVEQDGTWLLYFSTWDSASTFAKSEIGRASASSPDGPFVADPEPILPRGPEGSWDAQQVMKPSIIRTSDGYVMFYTGRAANRTASIGRAVSSDGIVWVKYDNPETDLLPFSESDPVFLPGEAGWDSGWVWQPNVVLTPQGWVMLYKGAVKQGDLNHHGVALSRDGVSWQRLSSEPLFEADQTPGGNRIWHTELVYDGGVYYLYYELALRGSNMTRPYVAIHSGELGIP